MSDREKGCVTYKLFFEFDESPHCIKSVGIRSYSGPYFLVFFSVRMQENSDQNNSEYRHFLRSVMYYIVVMNKEQRWAQARPLKNSCIYAVHKGSPFSTSICFRFA